MPDDNVVTDFQRRVYEVLCRVPRGCVTTYRDLAEAIGCASPRAVGQALRRNPFAPVVPCHRVIASDLTLGGFAGERSGAPLRRKLRLLAAEGVRFRDGRLLDGSRRHVFGRADLTQAPQRNHSSKALDMPRHTHYARYARSNSRGVGKEAGN
jgi:methylated-DNA-[protein]-cysteine S-methyltransferase